MKKTKIEELTFSVAICKIYPSTLSLFKQELSSFGGFDELMIAKKALERVDDRSVIITHDNIKDYKKKFLVGEYKKLRPFYSTKVPYSFWSQLYIEAKKSLKTS